MKRVIVSGANGFIGSYLVRELANNGVEVFAILRSPDADASSISNINNLKVVFCDLSEISELPNMIPEIGFDAFYHFAWVGSSGELQKNYEVQINNIKYSCLTLEVAVKLQCKKFIFAGSIMEYEAIQFVGKDDVRPSMVNIYKIAKLTADYLLKTLSVEYSIQYISGIISNVYGPGEFSTRFINTLLRKIIKEEHISLTSGEQPYDFIYITDAARAFFLLGEKGIAGNSYYIGNSEQKKLKYFMLIIKELIKGKYYFDFGQIPYNGSFLDYSEINTNALEKQFGFAPQINFEEGIVKTYNWIINHSASEGRT